MRKLLVFFLVITIKTGFAQQIAADSLKSMMWNSINPPNPVILEKAIRLGGNLNWFQGSDYLLIRSISVLHGLPPEKLQDGRKVIEILIRFGADINYSYDIFEYKDGFYGKTGYQNDVFLEALNSNDTVILEMLANKGIQSALFSVYNASTINLLAEYRILLQYYLNKSKYLQQILLSNALSHKDIEAIKFLQKQGIQINSFDNSRTALEMVIESKDTLFLNQLKQITVLDKMSGNTSKLAYAFKVPSSAMMIYFLDGGDDPNEIFYNGEDVLGWAIEYQDLNLLKAAIRHGADVNRKNKKGNMPLYEAKLKLSRNKTSRDIVAAIEQAGGREQ